MDARPHPHPDASIRAKTVAPTSSPGRSEQDRPVWAVDMTEQTKSDEKIDTEDSDLPSPAPPLIDPARSAFFLDFDGTLVDLAPRPDAVRMSDPTRRVLARLAAASRQAVAVVSGRQLVDVEQMLHPLMLAVSGGHGLERRNARGQVVAGAVDKDRLERIGGHLTSFAGEHEGLLVERKTGSVTLHFRARPELEDRSVALAERLAEAEQVKLLRGKMVVELLATRRTKADAIAEFMREQPFRGRVPVFAGDDVTDEAGFAHVAAAGGVTIKVGPGPTAAQHRVGGVRELLEWLERLGPR